MTLRALLAAALLALGPAVASAEESGHSGEPRKVETPKAVVELFTSQGCSSCVAADAFLAELAERGDVVALSLHVDYWDYLGWSDTLGDAANTERQRSYAAVHKTSRIYTPQLIVNGAQDFVGSDRRTIERALDGASLQVPVSMREGDGTVEIAVGAAVNADPAPATIRLALITSEAEVTIAHGENAGATVEYYNVVRAMRPIGMWSGGEVKITLPADELMGHGVDACAVLVQKDLPDGPGPIIGAAWLGHW